MSQIETKISRSILDMTVDKDNTARDVAEPEDKGPAAIQRRWPPG